MTIKIITRLNTGIADKYAGQHRVHHEFETGPRNFLKAIDTLIKHRKLMENNFGNIGCGSSWITIDGVFVEDSIVNDYFDMLSFASMKKTDYEKMFGYSTKKPTRTDWAKNTFNEFVKKHSL